ncbi:MAG: hypothetical protein HFI87_06495 [Bacilli bacterium]|nr:hypothetical protein [Bacilli bacterium]
MNQNNEPKGLFLIDISPSAETKRLSDIDNLLTDKDELLFNINQNTNNLNKEQISYLKSLLNLDISIFENDKLNEHLIEHPLFVYIARYNLYEGILRILKQMDNIEQDKVKVKIALPDKNWLEIWGCSYTELFSFPLLEIEHVLRPKVEIDIFDSNGYTSEFANTLIENYKKKGKSSDEIALRLKDHESKREMQKNVAKEFLNYWKLSEFPDKSSYDEKVKRKILSWAIVSKQNLDD